MTTSMRLTDGATPSVAAPAPASAPPEVPWVRPDRILDAVSDALLAVDATLCVRWANPAAAALLGAPEPVGRSIADLVADDTDAAERLRTACLHVLMTSDSVSLGVSEQAVGHTVTGEELECRLSPVTAGPPDQDDHVNGVLVALRDGDAAGRTLRAALHLAEHDALTGLHNRHYLARIGGRRTGDGRAVLFLDADGFKAINDGHGHAVGDAVIQEIGEVLRGAIRRDDHLVRIGGDEFVVILDSCGLDRAVVVAGELVAAVAGHEFSCDGTVVRLGLSAGVAAQTVVGSEGLDDAIRRADLACYAAKTLCRTHVAVDDPDTPTTRTGSPRGDGSRGATGGGPSRTADQGGRP